MKFRTPFIVLTRIIMMLLIVIWVFPIAWIGFMATGVMDGIEKWWKATKDIASTFFLKEWWTDW